MLERFKFTAPMVAAAGVDNCICKRRRHDARRCASRAAVLKDLHVELPFFLSLLHSFSRQLLRAHARRRASRGWLTL
jgi:hypothetical protein